MHTKTVALVTGANKGIGREIARQLGKRGITVVLGARDEAKGNAVVEELRREDIDAHFVKLDVGSAAEVAALPGFFKDKLGRLDLLVNNAGVAEWTSDDLETFRRTLEANLFGVVAVTYALIPVFEASPAGRIKVNAAHPGWVKTALGGDMAPMEVQDGAKTPVSLATLPADGPTGGFFHMGERMPW